MRRASRPGADVAPRFAAAGGGDPRELGALFEDRGLEVADRGRRLEPELVAQPVAEVVRGAQRLGLPARAVEREHQLAAEPLAQRMIDEERFELADDLFVVADPQLGVDARLDRDDVQLVEPDRLRPDPFRVGELGERRAAPLAERGVERRRARRTDRIRGGACAVGELALEAAGVDEVRRAPRARSPGARLRSEVCSPPSSTNRRSRET